MITELCILIYTENDKSFDLLRSHLKFFTQQNLLVSRVKNLKEFQEKVIEDHIDIFVIESSSDSQVNQDLWENLRSPSLVSRRSPLIWIGEQLKDSRFKIELELGLSQRIEALNDLSTESPKMKECLKTAYEYLEFANERTFSICYLKPGEYLFRKGEIGDHVFILISGKLEARERNQEKPGEYVLGAIEPGEFVGELATLQKARRMADVSAKTAVEVMKIPAAQFEMLLTTKISWSNKLLHLFAKRLYELSSRLSGRSAA